MERTRLNWKKNLDIIHECDRRNVKGGRKHLESVSTWAVQSLSLKRKPSYRTISRILAERTQVTQLAQSRERYRKKKRTARNEYIEEMLRNWVVLLWTKNVSVTDRLIQAKALRLYQQWNNGATASSKYGSRFSRGWLSGFKTRHKFKSRKSHGEKGDADYVAANAATPVLRALIAQYGENNVFNADECAFWWRRAPKYTIGPAALAGRKTNKDRVSVLLCSNTNGVKLIRPRIIGPSERPQCFRGTDPSSKGWEYSSSKRAWMNTTLFKQWLLCFNAAVAVTRRECVLLLIDNASCHGTSATLPNLSHVDIHFLPKRTTSILQPMDAGVIASVKKRYIQRQNERAVDRIDRGLFDDPYKLDLNVAITWLYDIWHRLPPAIIRNCWRKTRLVD